MINSKWHTGRTVGRTIYSGDGPDDLIGVMDTREIAAHIVRLHNRYIDEQADNEYREVMHGRKPTPDVQIRAHNDCIWGSTTDGNIMCAIHLASVYHAGVTAAHEVYVHNSHLKGHAKVIDKRWKVKRRHYVVVDGAEEYHIADCYDDEIAARMVELHNKDLDPPHHHHFPDDLNADDIAESCYDNPCTIER
jgi:hypothetical protein